MGHETPAERVAYRLREAGLSTERRFTDVTDGGKRSPVDHTDPANRHGPDAVSGNSGIYAGDGLVILDIDDYGSGADRDGVAAVDGLPETFTVETPHTDGETGGHRFYAVEPGEEFETAREACEAVCGVPNPSPSWGEVRVHHQYVVAPGSVLDGCGKGWCDECEEADSGRYRISADREKARITTDELADVLRADAQYKADGGVSPISPTEDGTPLPSTQSVSVSGFDLPDKPTPHEAMKGLPGTDSFIERWHRITQEPWADREKFLDLLHGDNQAAGYVSADGSGDRSAGELTFARAVGFWFCRNKELARYVFEELAFLSKCHENRSHRADMYRAVETVDWTYTNVVRLDTRIEVGQAVQRLGTAKKAEIAEAVGWSDRQVERSLQYLRRENAVALDRRGKEGTFWVERDKLGAFIDTYGDAEKETADESAVQSIASCASLTDFGAQDSQRQNSRVTVRAP